MIVNNAVPQPDDVGYIYNLYGTVQDTARAHADSALYDACHSLGKSIVDVPFFNDVLLYHGGTRQNTKYLEDEKLTPEIVKELCRETGTDAVISFDRLLFQMEKDVVAFAEGFVVGGSRSRLSSRTRQSVGYRLCAGQCFLVRECKQYGAIETLPAVAG